MHMDIRHLTLLFLGCRLIFAGQCDQANFNLCENGGTCFNTDNDDYECICQNGYSGKNCSINDDDCSENLCASGSTCIDGVAKYTCSCPPGKIGLFCHLDDPCMQRPCRSGAECVVDTASGDYSCNCIKGTTGSDCATDVNECEQNDHLCFNGGICVNTFGSWYCDCPVGYSDPYCMTQDSKCEPNACLNGASCLDYGNRYECICANGFYGKNCENACPAGFDDSACKQHRISLENNHMEESFEKEICKLHNCTSKALNDICDSECNYPACQYDGYDCSAHLEPFLHCPNPGFCARVFQDHKCNPVCDRRECLFDGFDCRRKTETCLFEDYCFARFNDGYCDLECASEECYFDGTDCKQEIKQNKLDGNLILIILMKPDEFLKRAPALQFILSQSMRAIVTIAFDEQNQKRIYAWESDEGGKHLSGSKVHFDVANYCQKEDNDCERKITDMENVANFVGAISSNQVLRRIGIPVHAAETEFYSDKKSLKKLLLYVIAGFLSKALLIGILFAIHNNFKQRRTKRRKQKVAHVAGTWYPPTLDNYFSFQFSGNYQEGGLWSSTGRQSKKITETENRQGYQFSEIHEILIDETENERRWTALHEEALSSHPIKIPVDSLLVNVRSGNGRTALMLTALNQEKTEEVSCADVENLLQAGASIDEQDDCGETALVMAIKTGRADVVKFLLRYGADPAILDDHRRTTLHHAASINAADIIRILLETREIEVDAIDDKDCSPLMTVAKLGYRDPETIALLIDAGADINCTGNHANGEMYIGRTALHYAVMQNNQELARYLVEHGANLNIQDHMGQTPLFLAASQGHVEMVHMLITAGARRCIPDNMDQTPEEIARIKEYREVVDYFASLRSLNGTGASGKRKPISRKCGTDVKKPRIIDMSADNPRQITKMLTNFSNNSETPENSNSSNSSYSFELLKERTNNDTNFSYENTPQMQNLSTNNSWRRSQEIYMQVPNSYSEQPNKNQYHNTQASNTNSGRKRPSNVPFIGIEHYV